MGSKSAGKKVLIFGAYANGNIGDQYQANSVAYHLKRLCPNLSVYATSNSSADKVYEFDDAFKLADTQTITNPEIVNGFDALIIGGGGLLASKHAPLANADWVESLQTPVALLAVGASPDVADQCSALLAKAEIVTARDEYSVETLSAFRSDCTFLNDPILADRRLDVDDSVVGQPAHDLCIIPRKQTDKNTAVYAALQRELIDRDHVVSMFPETDHMSGSMASFENSGQSDLWQMHELVNAIDRSKAVVSERYHGCIVALKRQKPCIGLISSINEMRSKVGELFNQVGHGHLLLSFRSEPLDRSQLLTRVDQFDPDVVRARINDISDTFDEQLSAILTRLNLRQVQL